LGKTIVEKILGRASGKENVSAGEIVNAKISFLMTNDAVGELTVKAFEELGTEVWDRERVAVILDHFVPATTENAARVHSLLRAFAKKNGTHLLDQEGVCHQVMIEKFVVPGDVVIGTDSHTCTYGGIGAFATGIGSTDGAAAMATGELWFKVPETINIELSGTLKEHVYPKDAILKIIGDLGADGATYKALQFSGKSAKTITNAGRFTMCNMAIEAGAKVGIFEPDEITQKFLKEREKEDGGEFFESDPDAEYCDFIPINLQEIEPKIACPWSVDNVKPVVEVEGIEINQAFVGSCTNGRLEDLEVVAKILKGKKVNPYVRFLITPASRKVYQQALKAGFINVFLEAGVTVCNPSCSACFGGQGTLWKDEVCIGSHNRNFRARMGHKDSKVYLASPETVAVSAITGKITDPRRLKK
jgi:3-isopropylmalate/(R)-2-methylmalate dehydratase large subunit